MHDFSSITMQIINAMKRGPKGTKRNAMKVTIEVERNEKKKRNIIINGKNTPLGSVGFLKRNSDIRVE